jgi:hypothetical protein
MLYGLSLLRIWGESRHRLILSLRSKPLAFDYLAG